MYCVPVIHIDAEALLLIWQVTSVLRDSFSNHQALDDIQFWNR